MTGTKLNNIAMLLIFAGIGVWGFSKVLSR